MRDINLSYESLTSKEALKLLLQRVGEDPKFYQSLSRFNPGEEDKDDDDTDEDNQVVQYDEIDSSKTIDAAIEDVLRLIPAGSLAEIYADDSELLSESDSEDRGTGANLDMYTGAESSTCNATGRWMEWNSK